MTELEAAERALADALAAKAQAEEDAHYANGVTDLALQRRDTAEAQVAAILGIVAQFRNGRIEGVTIDPGLARTQREIDAAAAANDVCDAVLEVLEIEIKRSMPDSAAKLRAVVDAAEKLHGYLARTKVVYRDSTNLRLQATPHYEAFDNAVAAYKASRTGEDEQEGKLP